MSDIRPELIDPDARDESPDPCTRYPIDSAATDAPLQVAPPTVAEQVARLTERVMELGRSADEHYRAGRHEQSSEDRCVMRALAEVALALEGKP